MKTAQPITHLMRFVYLQLPLFTKKQDECDTFFERWIYVLKNMNVLDKLPDAYQCEAFNKLKQVADISAMTAEEFADYEWSRRHYYDWETTKYFMEKEKEEAEKAKEEAKQAKEEAKQAKEEAKQAKEESKQAKEESKQAKEESKQAKEESKQAKEETKQAKEETKQAKEETKQAKEESKQAKEAKLNMARYMKSHGTPIEEIKALSNLTEEEINAL
jgi:uncharacterized phage infection (PIP) family protein YhgE